MTGFSAMSRGCRNGYKFSSQVAAEFAVIKGADGDPYKCSLCPWWHLKVPVVRTGFSAEVMLLARVRAGSGDASRALCEACGTMLGRYGGDVQHRLARGSGGSSSEMVGCLANAAVLCRPDHRKAESRALDMRDDGAGWWIRSGKGPAFDPRFVPVRLHSGTVRWLHESEPRYLDEAPGRWAA